jgi:hypothetical protein
MNQKPYALLYWVRLAWTRKFGLTLKVGQSIDCQFARQLARCKDDDARRILLGIRDENKEE